MIFALFFLFKSLDQLKRKCEDIEADAPAPKRATPKLPVEAKIQLKVPVQPSKQATKISITQVEIPKKNTPPLPSKQDDLDFDAELDAAVESESSEDSADAIFRELGAEEEQVIHPKPIPVSTPQPIAKLVAPVSVLAPKPVSQVVSVPDLLNTSTTHNSSSTTASSSTTDSSDDDSD